MYFIGNVLDSHAQAAQHPEANKEHFHITPDEALSIDATGLPVHLEHADNVKVGSVVRSWNDADGKKWVVAKVDTSSIEGKFVRNDLSAETPVYSSLSLQHVYSEFTDGTSNKRPIEVSICKEPRRPGCKIVHASAPSNCDMYKGSGYKTRMTTENSIDTTTNLVANDTAPPTATAEVPDVTEPSTTQLMAEVVEASRHNTELQKQLEEKTYALAEIERQKKESEEFELKKQTQLAVELGDAVLEHVAKLDPALANKDTEEAIGTLREKYPSQVSRLLEVACCASKHASKLEVQLAKQKEEMERKLMEQRYHAAVAERPGCHGQTSSDMPVVAEEVVHASKRAKTEANPYAVNMARPSSSQRYVQSNTIEQIHAAYQGLHGRGSTTDAMKAVAGIIPQQRAHGFR